MSNYYLCDQCKWWIKWRPGNFTGLEGRCSCKDSGTLFLKKAMIDSPDFPYDEPLKVCPSYKPKQAEFST